MAYVEVSVVVDGALYKSEVFDDDDKGKLEYSKFIQEQKDIAAKDSCPTEIYELWHEHDESQGMCDCVCYLTDHKPLWANKANGAA